MFELLSKEREKLAPLDVVKIASAQLPDDRKTEGLTGTDRK